jgi:hypothetical protein
MAYSLEFDYKHEYSDVEEGIPIPVELSYGKESMRVTAKLDSGSDVCLFSREIGEKLGIDVESGDKLRLSSMNGFLDSYGHEVEVEISGVSFSAVVYFAKDEGLVRNLLGRRGAIRLFQIGLVDYESVVYFKWYG